MDKLRRAAVAAYVAWKLLPWIVGLARSDFERRRR
jgi:hypothetical protein